MIDTRIPKKRNYSSPVSYCRVKFQAVLWWDYPNSLIQKADSCSRTLSPIETQAKSVKPKWQTMKELWRAQAMPKERKFSLPCHFPPKTIGSAGLVDFQSKSWKTQPWSILSFSLFGPYFLLRLAMSDKPPQGRSLRGNGWAVLQGTQSVR